MGIVILFQLDKWNPDQPLDSAAVEASEDVNGLLTRAPEIRPSKITNEVSNS